MSYIKPHLSPELRAQITPQNKRDRKMIAAGAFLLVGSLVLTITIWPKNNNQEATINSKLESIGAQTNGVSFGIQDKQVLGAATSAEEASAADQDANQDAGQEAPKVSAVSGGEFTSYTVKDGDTLFNISQAYGVNWDLIAEFNSLSEPYILHAGDVIKIPQATTSSVPGKIYTIVKGDTLVSIAKEYNITVDDIIAVNPNLQKSDLISIGQVIKLP